MQLAPAITVGVFAEAAAIFLGLLLVQLSLWRALRVKKQILWLFIVFMLVPMAGMFWFRDFPERCAAYALSLAMGLQYLFAFPAAQAQSPSLVMLRLISSRRDGISRETLLAEMGQSGLLEDRLQDLANDGLMSQSVPSGVGRIIAQTFILYRKLLRLPKGGG